MTNETKNLRQSQMSNQYDIRPVVVTDNFLAEEEFTALRDQIFEFNFSWHFSDTVVYENEEPSPGGLSR